MIRKALGTAIALCGIIAVFSLHVQAQQWEAVYGEDTAEETGMKIIEVTQPCNPGGLGGPPPGFYNDGFIAVGTTDYPGDTDVHVVRMDYEGRIYWERHYDIDGMGGDDEAYDIVETPIAQGGGGWSITGRTWANNDLNHNGYDAFILQINCAGDVIWTNTYGGTGDETGNAIISANGGDGITTFPLDLVVAGASTTGSAASEGYVLRVDPMNGAIRVARKLRPTTGVHPIVSAGFNDLVEPRRDSLIAPFDAPIPFDTVFRGDIFLVGWCEGCNDNLPPNDRQAFAARVDQNLAFSAAPKHRMSEWGDIGHDEYFGVVDSLPVHYGHPPGIPVYTTYPIMATGIYQSNKIGMVRFDEGVPDQVGVGPTGAATHQDAIYISSPAVPGIGQHDIAFDIDMMPLTSGCGDILAGDFAITGEAAASAAQGSRDAFIAIVRNPFALNGVGASIPWSSRFGYEGLENGNSIEFEDVQLGCTELIMAANTTSDPMTVGDPSDMYIVRATENLLSDCELSYNPSIYGAPDVRFVSRHEQVGSYISPELSTDEEVDWFDNICGDISEGPAGKTIPTNHFSAVSSKKSSSAASYTHQFGSSEHNLHTADNAVISVYRVNGESVESLSDVTNSDLDLSSLNRGHYFVHISNSDTTPVVARLLVR